LPQKIRILRITIIPWALDLSIKESPLDADEKYSQTEYK
jgi:hypothetical protein